MCIRDSGSTGQQLDEVPTCCGHRKVFVHQDPKGTGGGNLFTLGKVGGDVFCNFPRHQGDGSHIGLFHPQIFDDRQRTVGAHCLADVQFGRSFQGKVYLTILYIAPYVSLAV